VPKPTWGLRMLFEAVKESSSGRDLFKKQFPILKWISRDAVKGALVKVFDLLLFKEENNHLSRCE
jgi:hypothetical protein